MTLNRKALWKALIASFSVYLLPVFTVHYVYVWGWGIGAEIFAGEGDRDPLWLAADAGLALAFQAAAFILFTWLFSGRMWRWLLLLPAVPAFGLALTWAYVVALPPHS